MALTVLDSASMSLHVLQLLAAALLNIIIIIIASHIPRLSMNFSCIVILIIICYIIM